MNSFEGLALDSQALGSDEAAVVHGRHGPVAVVARHLNVKILYNVLLNECLSGLLAAALLCSLLVDVRPRKVSAVPRHMVGSLCGADPRFGMIKLRLTLAHGFGW